MYYQVNLVTGPHLDDQPRWLPKMLAPAQPERPAEPPASTPDTGSVSRRDELYIELSEALLGLAQTFPGLAADVAPHAPLQPGETRKQHFHRLAGVLSDRAPRYPGLGKAIADTLEPFAEDPRWQ